jgi:uncharacterized protein
MSFLIGLLAGTFGGLVGLGGGVVMVPLLAGVLKLEQRVAHGTSLLALVFTGIIGAATYASNNALDLEAAVFLAAGAIWPARWGAKICHALAEHKLKRVFGIFLIFISVLLMVKPYLHALPGASAGAVKIALLLGTGAVTGFLSGLMGIGGGAVMISAMVLLMGYAQHAAQGTSLLTMVPAGVVGAYTHWRLGSMAPALLKGLIPGIILGTYAGGTFAQLLPESNLRFVFAAVLIATGANSMRQGRQDGSPPPTC